MPSKPIPAFINPESGTRGLGAGGKEEVGDLIERDERFELRRVEAPQLAEAVGEAVRAGARRVLVVGGDGSVASAAGAVVHTRTELAIVPTGTLNHFARDHEIPLDVAEALDFAAEATAIPADAAYVNGQLFLNTSSVGTYVRFVERRESLEPRVGYRIASILASLRTFAVSRPFKLKVDAEGRQRFYSTTLAFIGLGERELRIPVLGSRVKGGRRGLHLLIPRASSHTRLLQVAATSALRGVQAAVGSLELDSFLVEECRFDLRRPRGDISIDGEIVSAATPLHYHVERDALRVVAST
ncbi:MAG TPA: diacylglycerol kinase family protein [Gemmatimonadaceae bacterium]